MKPAQQSRRNSCADALIQDAPAGATPIFWMMWLRWTLTSNSRRANENEDPLGFPYLVTHHCLVFALQIYPPHALKSLTYHSEPKLHQS